MANLLSALWECPADAIETATQSWTAESDHALKDFSLDGLLSVGIVLADIAARVQGHLWEQLYAIQLADTQQAGQDLLRMYQRTFTALDHLEACVREVEARGQNPEQARPFREARRRLRTLHEDFSSRWPLFPLEELEAGRVQIARGEFVTGEEHLCELDRQDRNGSCRPNQDVER